MTCLTQKLIDEVYEKWQGDYSFTEFASRFFTPAHSIAAKLGEMNYQVGNGGWEQWHSNGHSEDLDDLIKITKDGLKHSIKHFDKLFKILRKIKNLGHPETYDEETYCKLISKYDDEYYEIDEDDLINSFDEYLNIVLKECERNGFTTTKRDNKPI